MMATDPLNSRDPGARADSDRDPPAPVSDPAAASNENSRGGKGPYEYWGESSPAGVRGMGGHLDAPRKKAQWLLALVAVSFIGVFLLAPIPQDPAYHQFADQRSWLGIPNAANVLSNLPFILVGWLGLRDIVNRRALGLVPEFRIGYLSFFAGLAAIGLGSAYYHWQPDNYTLVWDRLPMTVSIMALVAIIAAEHLSVSLGQLLLWPLQALGIASVMFWYLTELGGAGDLRLYGVVQFLPMVLIPLVLWWFPSRLSDTSYLWGLLAGYAVAKLAELLDEPISRLLVGISGHTLKHLVAAGAAAMLLMAVRHRKLWTATPGPAASAGTSPSGPRGTEENDPAERESAVAAGDSDADA